MLPNHQDVVVIPSGLLRDVPMFQPSRRNGALILSILLLMSLTAFSTTENNSGKPSYVNRLPEDRQQDSCSAFHLP